MAGNLVSSWIPQLALEISNPSPSSKSSEDGLDGVKAVSKNVGDDSVSDWYWSSTQCCMAIGADTNTRTWWMVGISVFLLGFLLVLIPTLHIYAFRCLWGHAADIDYGGNKNFFVVYGVNHKVTGTKIVR